MLSLAYRSFPVISSFSKNHNCYDFATIPNQSTILCNLPVDFVAYISYNVVEQRPFALFKSVFWPTRPQKRKDNLTDEVALARQSRVRLAPYPFFLKGKESVPDDRIY